jgi:hypothetical protein
MDPIGSLAEVDDGKLAALAESLDGLPAIEGLLAGMAGSAGGGDDVPPKKEPAASTQATIGSYRFTIPRRKYEKWVEAIRQEVGFDEDSIVAEIKKRLGL